MWTISGKDERQFHKKLPNLLQVQDENVQSQITTCPGECRLAGVINNRLMHFGCNVIKMVDYLALLFEKDCEYRTIGCHRSVISVFHDYVEGKPVGQHPEVCALVSGIFNNRPPQSRYMFVWSMESVIN